MKTIYIILPGLFVCGVLTAQSEWKIEEHEGRTILIHGLNTKGEEAPSIGGLVKILDSRDQSLPLSHITFWTYFNNDPTIQAELLSEFKSRHPDILTAAFKSSGNMHNPKVIPLGSKISECLLATPTLTKINELLHTHGYVVTQISHEKFWINKDSEEKPFHATMWLMLEPTIKKEAQQAAPSNR